MSDRREKVYAAIKRWITQNGYAPTIREIGAEIGVAAPSIVMFHLNALHAEGRIIKVPGVARGIRLSQDDDLVAENRRLREALRQSEEKIAALEEEA